MTKRREIALPPGASPVEIMRLPSPSIRLLTRPAAMWALVSPPSVLRTTGDARSIFIDDERVSVRCRCGTDNGGDTTKPIVCAGCGRLLATPER